MLYVDDWGLRERKIYRMYSCIGRFWCFILMTEGRGKIDLADIFVYWSILMFYFDDWVLRKRWTNQADIFVYWSILVLYVDDWGSRERKIYRMYSCIGRFWCFILMTEGRGKIYLVDIFVYWSILMFGVGEKMDKSSEYIRVLVDFDVVCWWLGVEGKKDLPDIFVYWSILELYFDD